MDHTRTLPSLETPPSERGKDDVAAVHELVDRLRIRWHGCVDRPARVRAPLDLFGREASVGKPRLSLRESQAATSLAVTPRQGQSPLEGLNTGDEELREVLGPIPTK